MKKKIVLLALASLMITTPVFGGEFVEPSEAVNAYITGVKTGSGAHLEQAFADTARIQFYDDRDEYLLFTRSEFAAMVDGGSDWEANIEITNLLKTGNAANATVEFTWGDSDQHGYVDYLNLIYVDGSWRITNKVAQYVARK